MKSTVLRCFLKVATQTVFRSDMGSRFRTCGPAAGNVLESADDEMHGMSYCPVSAERRCTQRGSVESGTTACWRQVGMYPNLTPCIKKLNLYVIRWRTGSQWSICSTAVMWSRGHKSRWRRAVLVVTAPERSREDRRVQSYSSLCELVLKHRQVAFEHRCRVCGSSKQTRKLETR